MRLGKALSFLFSFVPLALGDVLFTVPSAAGDSFPGGSPFILKWGDSGSSPSISDLTTYTLALFTGSNTAPVPIPMSLAPGTVATGTASVTIPPGVGGSTPAAYFFQMTSVKADGGSVINYSSRFTLTGMTGTFTADVLNALGTVIGTIGPPTQLIAAGGGAAAGTDGGQYAVPYNQQTGLIKYAPMQPLPPHTITKQNTSPLWPTSSASTATTLLPIPSIQTTSTQYPTYSFASHENTAAAQSQPTGDMEKFLNRWKD